MLGILRGKKPGKTVAIREDIDALPMPELTGLPFASEIPNVCHSCGHDIHTTVLLYCARVLSQIRDELAGTVMFLFQPAEEKGCGAKQFIDCDFTRIAKPDVFIGLHVSPEYDAGTIALKKGPGCASNDFFHIKIIPSPPLSSPSETSRAARRPISYRILWKCRGPSGP